MGSKGTRMVSGFYSLHRSLNVVRLIKSGRRAGHVARMREFRGAFKILTG